MREEKSRSLPAACRLLEFAAEDGDGGFGELDGVAGL
jgi:hypothetical protein